MTWIVPNFRNKTVSEVETDTPNDITVKIKIGDDGAWHEPDSGEQTLVVEDNFINQKVAQRMLERLGCEVEIANDGREAVERVRRTEYDIVFRRDYRV